MTTDCHRPGHRRLALAAGLIALGSLLSGCAGMSDNMSTAFADPAKYDLYDCKQLETERKSLAARTAELQGLMAKAETGTGGVVVAELAYRNDYVAIRGQSQFAEEAWRRNKCQERPPRAASRPNRRVRRGRWPPPVRPVLRPCRGTVRSIEAARSDGDAFPWQRIHALEPPIVDPALPRR